MEIGTEFPAEVKRKIAGRCIVQKSESEIQSSLDAKKAFKEQCERMLLNGYESDSESEYDFGDPLMSEEDWAAYWRQINESEGFEADLFLGSYEWEDILGVIEPASVEENYDEFKKIIEFAIEKRGKTNKIVLERIVNGNFQALAPCVYYITFEAKDMDDDDGGGLIKTYQTKVVLQIPDQYTFVEIFREKPN